MTTRAKLNFHFHVTVSRMDIALCGEAYVCVRLCVRPPREGGKEGKLLRGYAADSSVRQVNYIRSFLYAEKKGNVINILHLQHLSLEKFMFSLRWVIFLELRKAFFPAPRNRFSFFCRDFPSSGEREDFPLLQTNSRTRSEFLFNTYLIRPGGEFFTN